jgi:hypothetical protein
MSNNIERDFSQEKPVESITLSGQRRTYIFPETNLPFTEADAVTLLIKHGKAPHYLYKYRAPDLKSTLAPYRSTENIFTEQRLWFGKAVDFNDPFDSQLVYETENTLEDITDFIFMKTPGIYYEEGEELALLEAEKTSLAKEMFQNKEKWHEYINKFLKDEFDSIGICAFSEKYDNLLMWSHYSNSHTGLCLKFDLTLDPSFFYEPKKIIYNQNYPIANLAKGFYERVASQNFDLIDFLLTKSIDWEYEKEWRVFKYDNQIGAHKFKKEALTEVLFGCKASDEYIEHIRSLAAASGLTHLIYKKAKVNTTKFILDFHQLP